MNSVLLLTASGLFMILTSYRSASDPGLLQELKLKGFAKFAAFEVPLAMAQDRYGAHFHAVENDLHETDDLRVLDFDGQGIFGLFRFHELGAPTLQEDM